MSITHNKEAHTFTLSLDVDREELWRLGINAAKRIDYQVSNMSRGQKTAGESMLGTWHEQLTDKLFRKTPHYAWLEQHKVEYTLYSNRHMDIHDGLIHILIWGDKHAAMFKLAFSGQPSAIAA